MVHALLLRGVFSNSVTQGGAPRIRANEVELFLATHRPKETAA